MPESLWRQWKLFASAVIKHWFFTGGGVVVAILTYVWGQIRHMIYQDGPDIPMWAFYAGALLLIGLGCFLAWRDEHIAKLNEQAQRVLESEAAGVEIARLKADPPVVLFEFPIQDIFRPSMIRTLKASGGYMGHHEEQQLPEIHSVKDNCTERLEYAHWTLTVGRSSSTWSSILVRHVGVSMFMLYGKLLKDRPA